MKRLFLISSLILFALAAKAEGNLMFEQANALYHSNNYDSAAKLYTRLVQNGYGSDDLFYNMGNAFYKSGKIGWAIWSYKKSMRIKCQKNTLDNYFLAKKKIKNPLIEQDDIFFIKWWQSLYSLFSVNVWAIIAFIAFIIFLITMYLRLVKNKRLAPLLSYLFLGIFLLSAFLMFIQYYNAINHYEAVVVDNAFFESASNQVRERIPEGSEVKMLDNEPEKRDGQVMVKLSDLREGYLPKEAIKRL